MPDSTGSASVASLAREIEVARRRSCGHRPGGRRHRGRFRRGVDVDHDIDDRDHLHGDSDHDIDDRDDYHGDSDHDDDRDHHDDSGYHDDRS